MIISRDNAEIINSRQVYIHDHILLLLEFDRIDKKMRLKLKKHPSDIETYTIEFTDVQGFSMSSCDFWGASECVLDFEYVNSENSVMMLQLKKQSQNVSNSFESLSDKHFETLMTFTSGDQLRVVCQEINLGRQGTVSPE